MAETRIRSRRRAPGGRHSWDHSMANKTPQSYERHSPNHGRRRGATPTRQESRPGESAGGIAPPAARRTVRKPLGLHGSHRPAIRFEAEAPVSEQARRASSDADQEKPCPFLAWRSRLNLRMAQRTKWSLRRRRRGYNMDL